MKVVVVSLGKRKFYGMLLLSGLIMAFPLFIYIQSPTFNNPASISNSEPQSNYVIFLCMFLIGGCATLALLRLLLSAKVGLELTEKGIRYNAFGGSEQFLAADSIHFASLERTAKGGSALLVLKKEGRGEYGKLPLGKKLLKTAPAMRIWHELLEGGPADIADTINQYYELANENAPSDGVVSTGNTTDHKSVFTGLALITLGFVTIFATAPNGFGLVFGLAIIVLGSIITCSCPSKLNSNFPRHIISAFQKSFNTMIKWFTAPQPVLSSRLAGAVIYPIVGTPVLYLILPYINCRLSRCEKAYDISSGFICAMFVMLLVIGFGMGIGRKTPISK